MKLGREKQLIRDDPLTMQHRVTNRKHLCREGKRCVLGRLVGEIVKGVNLDKGPAS